VLTHFKSKFSKNFKSSITTPPLLFLPASAPPQFRSSPNFFFNYILEFYKTKTKSYDYSVLFLLSPRLEKRNVRFTFVSPFQKKNVPKLQSLFTHNLFRFRFRFSRLFASAPQVVFAWAVQLGGEQGARLLARFGLTEQAVEYALEAGQYGQAPGVGLGWYGALWLKNPLGLCWFGCVGLVGLCRFGWFRDWDFDLVWVGMGLFGAGTYSV